MSKNYMMTVIAMVIFSFAYAQKTPDQIGRDWIEKNRTNLKIANDDNFILRASRSSLSGHTLRYQQTINGVPVYDTEITIHISKKNKITNVANNFDDRVSKINTAPAVFKTSALDIAKSHINAQGNFSREESKLYVYNKMDATRLVYVNRISATTPVGYWEVIIDAQTGEVLKAEEISIKRNPHAKIKKSTGNGSSSTPVKHAEKTSESKKSAAVSFLVDGTGMIFDPDPLSASGQTYGGNYSDNNDAANTQLNAARSSVTLKDIDFSGGVYTLKGPYTEIKDLEAPSKGLFTQANSNFNFDRGNDGFEAVNCYYHLDKSLRYINETLGITLVSLFNNGVLEFDPSAWNGQDNSSYGGGQLRFGEGGVDDGEDADVILHELGHGLHDWITNGSLSQVNGLSEGCGDYWAQSYKRSLGQWQSTDASYHFVFGWDGHNEFWPGRSTNHSASYPGGLTGSIHTDGQIWATSLMRIFDIIGREKTDKAFLEGLGMTNSSTNQENAAIAVRQAAIDMGYSCADVDVFTTQFTNTGYNMPAINLVINCPGNQTALSDPSNTMYTIPDYTGMANAINTGCTATVTQSPAAGTSVAEGTHTITLTATAGSSVNCTFQLTVDSSLSIDDFILKTGLILYPVPANDNIIVEGRFDNKETLEVYDILGQKLMEVSIDQNITNIDISKLSKGVYFATFKGQKGSLKFVKN
ncbi:T9SS type A sorting domain-containing protein [Aquimarina sp. 2201CG5-10]|uniref:T9SS type A sorting domain-containing protein n=1 Tax=Aquimarina callyspongiae TaxID=3098150 RepID=UPI002AB4C5C4|nr:T9SS type A sorting domain-containing protein [Aquimarina sp. 2201CG5-10]MDY8138369.1 T9SS type A sorting domain-containing protein [Aquimarina sp. 2201CG5-10]